MKNKNITILSAILVAVWLGFITFSVINDFKYLNNQAIWHGNNALKIRQEETDKILKDTENIREEILNNNYDNNDMLPEDKMKDYIKNKFNNETSIDFIDINIKNKTIYITINFKEKTISSKAKAIIENNFSDVYNEYEYQFILTSSSKDFPIFGSKFIYDDNISW